MHTKQQPIFELSAEIRKTLGKGPNKRLRKADKVPGILYGGEQEPTPIMVEHKILQKALENEAFYSHILTITINGKQEKAVLKDLHRHPYKPKILHFDLQRITGKHKIHMHIPLHFIGENQAPGVKNGGIVIHHINDIEIRCLPQYLPESIDIDISKLELNRVLHISDITLPQHIELVNVTNQQLPVVSIQLPRAAVEESTESATAAPAAATTSTTAEKEKK